MTKRTDRPADLVMWRAGDIEAQIEENVALRKRNYELEQWCIRAQDALRRALLLRIPSRELEEIVDSAPVQPPAIDERLQRSVRTG